MRKLILSNKIKNLALVLACLLVIGVFVFTLFACSNKAKESTPAQEIQTEAPAGEEPSGEGQQGGTDEPIEEDVSLESFLAALSNVQDKCATTMIFVSFGDKMLAQKTITYVRVPDGGVVRVETKTLAEAGATNPYVTEKSEDETLQADEFESRFPNIANCIDADLFKTVNYSLSQNGGTLTFTLPRDMCARLLSLTDAEASNVASAISVRIDVVDSFPVYFSATYTSSTGNNVKIIIAYS